MSKYIDPSLKRLHFIPLFLLLMLIQPLSAKEELLLPEIEAILKLPPLTEVELSQNLAIPLYGASYKSEDYLELGRDLAIRYYDQLKQSLDYKIALNAFQPMEEPFDKSHFLHFDLSIFDQDISYLFPCSEKKVERSCIEKTIHDRNIIDHIIEQNSILLARHKLLYDYEGYHAIAVNFASAPFPSFMNDIRASNSQIALAILKFSEGDEKAGYQILRDELQLAKKLLTPKPDYLSFSIGLRQMNQIYLVIDWVIDQTVANRDRSDINDHMIDIRLVELLKPLTEAEKRALYLAASYENRTKTQGLVAGVLYSERRSDLYRTMEAMILRLGAHAIYGAEGKKVYKNYVYGPYWIVNLHYLQEEVTLAKLLDLDSYKALSEKYQTLLSYYSDAGLYDIFLPTKSSSHDLLESNIEPFNELEVTLIRLRKKAGLE